MKRYFNLKIGSPDVNGSVIEVDTSRIPENRLRDYIASYRQEEHNLQFSLKEPGKDNSSVYEVVIPYMEFNAGAYVPPLAVNCGLEWSKTGEDLVTLVLHEEGTLESLKKKSHQGKNIFIFRITKSQAEKAKQDEFNWSMQQLYIAGY